jgi:GGDEF domain-containing protein
MDGAGTFGRKPRPVADAPAVDAVAVAKAWLLALVADAPLQQAGAVPAAELARGGPALCGALLAALGSDAELERLIGGDDRPPLGAAAARLTGARTPAALAAGVEALRAAAWRMLRAELRDAPPELVADLGDRLAYVCARVVQASLAAPGADVPRGGGPLAEALASSAPGTAAVPPAPEPPARAAPAERTQEHQAAQDAHDAAAREVAGLAPRPRFAGEAHRGRAAASQEAIAAAIERAAREAAAQRAGASAEAPPEAPTPAPTPAVPTAPPEGVELVDLPPPLPTDLDPLSSLAEELAAAPPTGVSGAPPASMFVPAADTPVVMRLRSVDTSWEELAEAGPPWLGSISRRLARRQVDGLPFAVLVVEIDDLDRVLAAQTGREVALALEEAERALTAELAPADLVVRERLGRWWLTSPDRDAAAARDLGNRVAAAIARSRLGGAPLRASIGLAVCPDDGETLDTLAGRADEGMFAARAAGVPLA